MAMLDSIYSVDDHPDNPRLVIRQDVIDGIAAQIEERGYFDPAHALMVRPLNGRYQIIWGHQRKQAAIKAGLSEVPCWVREMSNEEAYLQLGFGNAQGEWKPIEVGLHALGLPTEQGKPGGGLQAYADKMGKSKATVTENRSAAKVLTLLKGCSVGRTTSVDIERYLDKAQHLYHISKAPEDLWAILADWLFTLDGNGNERSVSQTEGLCKALRSHDVPLRWQNKFLALTDLAASPIEVYKVDGQYLLTDGFHRTAAANQLNRETIRAIVYEGSFQDAYAAACLANLQHGKPLTREERKKAICEYIKLKVKESNVLISRETGVSDTTVGKYRRELETKGEIEPQESRKGADGRTIKSDISQKLVTSNFLEVEDIEEIDPFNEWFNEHVEFLGNDALLFRNFSPQLYTLWNFPKLGLQARGVDPQITCSLNHSLKGSICLASSTSNFLEVEIICDVSVGRSIPSALTLVSCGSISPLASRWIHLTGAGGSRSKLVSSCDWFSLSPRARGACGCLG